MHLVELELERIKSYQRAIIPFRPGVNAIVGANGAGKSTILQAIGYAVFDSRPKIRTFIREDARQGRIRVRLQSMADGITYDVCRRVGGRSEYFVYNVDEDFSVCEGPRDVQQFLRLNMAQDTEASLSELFERVIGVAQGNFHAPFLLTAAPRKDYFSPLLGVESFKRAAERLVHTESHISILETEIKTRIAVLESHLSARAELETTLQELTADRQNLTGQLEEMERELQSLARVLAQFEALDAQVQTIARQLSDLEKTQFARQADLRELDVRLRRARGARAMVERHQPEHDRYLETEAALERIRDSLNQIQKLQLQKTDLLTRQEGDGERRDSLIRQLDRLADVAREAAQLEAVSQQYRDLEAQSVQTRLPPDHLDDLQRDIQRHRETLASLHRRQSEVEADLRQRAQLMPALQEAENQAQVIQGQIHILQAEMDQMQTRKAELLEQRAGLRKADRLLSQDSDRAADAISCPVCGQPLEPAALAQIQQRNAETIARQEHLLESKRRDWEIQKKLGGDLADTMRRLRGELSDLQDESQLSWIQSQEENANRQLEHHRSRLADAITRQNRYLGLCRYMAELRPAAARYQALAADLRLRPELEKEKNQIVRRLDAREASLSDIDARMTELQGTQGEEQTLRRRLRADQDGYRLVLQHQADSAQLDASQLDHDRMHETLQGLKWDHDRLRRTEGRLAVHYDRSTHLACIERQREVHTARTEVATRLEYVRRDLAQARNRMRKMEDWDTEYEEQSRKREVAARHFRHIVFLRQLLRDVQPRITSALIERISHEAHARYCELSGDHTKHLTWTSDFGIELEVNGVTREFQQLSGGERMTASLSVLMALLSSLTHVGFVFFDEPTTNLDADRRAELAEKLRAYASLSQLFVISHDDTFETDTQHLIRIHKEHDTSRVETSAP